MARVTYGSIVTSIDGSVGGHTFQKNNYGSSLRNKPLRKGSVSLSQMSLRVRMQRVVQAWALLTNAQRAGFDRFLSYSPDFSWHNSKSLLSGYALFVKWNYYYMRMFNIVNSSIVYAPVSLPVLNPSLTRVGAVLNFEFNSSLPTNDLFCQVRFSNVISDSSSIDNASKRDFLCNYLNDSVFDITYEYASNYGAVPSAGQSVVIGLTIVSALCPIVFAERLLKITIS